jgi:hypothetical protein
LTNRFQAPIEVASDIPNQDVYDIALQFVGPLQEANRACPRGRGQDCHS